MTAPVIVNDVEAVAEYATTLRSDADEWRNIATAATEAAETLQSDAASWEAEWEPEGEYNTAVSTMADRLTELATRAAATADAIEKRADDVVTAAQDFDNTDHENGSVIDAVPVLGDIARAARGLFG